MSAVPLRYQIQDANWQLEFSIDCQETLKSHIQRRRLSKESVGQLFTRDLTKGVVRVELVTVISPSWATFSRVKFDPKRAATEREELFKQGLHCIGLWHTHPEPTPEPSNEDLSLASDYALAAKATMTGLVFVIVGQSPFPAGLAVWVHDGEKNWVANNIQSSEM
jgi:proteasome lid subunit RPN8/RPN11